MKRVLATALVLAMALALAACTKQPASTPEQSPAPETSGTPVTSQSVSQPATQEEQPVPYGDWSLLYPEGMQGQMQGQTLEADNLNEMQKQMILTLAGNVVSGYNNGTLPLEVVPESEYYLNEALPQGASLPAELVWEDIEVVQFDERWQVVVRIDAGGGHTLSIAMSNSMIEDGAMIVIDEATFADVQPGEYP